MGEMTKNIMIIDDEDAIVLLLTTILSLTGIPVIVALSPLKRFEWHLNSNQISSFLTSQCQKKTATRYARAEIFASNA
jgi:DNA-binding NtrC family response regulator